MGAFLSRNLVGYVNGHLCLLYHVSRMPYLTEESEGLNDAIKRYKVFLTLRAYGLAQTTPVEIEWIWHVHRLHPVNYIKDCKNAFGHVVPSQQKVVKPVKSVLNMSVRQYIDMRTYEITESFPPEVQKLFDAFSPSLDLVGAAIRQKGFLEQSKIFYGCGLKLFRSLQKDYIMFLKLFKNKKDICYVPTLGIDLIWHTHMRFPEMYGKDTKKFCGFVLDHNDDIPEAKLNRQLTETSQVWSKKYRSTYSKPPSSAKNGILENDAYLNGTLYVYGAWGWNPYSYYTCDAPHHAEDCRDAGNAVNCTGGYTCGGTECGNVSCGGSCGTGGSTCGGTCGDAGGSSCGGGEGGGSSCGGGGSNCGSSCGGGCGGGGGD